LFKSRSASKNVLLSKTFRSQVKQSQQQAIFEHLERLMLENTVVMSVAIPVVETLMIAMIAAASIHKNNI